MTAPIETHSLSHLLKHTHNLHSPNRGLLVLHTKLITPVTRHHPKLLPTPLWHTTLANSLSVWFSFVVNRVAPTSISRITSSFDWTKFVSVPLRHRKPPLSSSLRAFGPMYAVWQNIQHFPLFTMFILVIRLLVFELHTCSYPCDVRDNRIERSETIGLCIVLLYYIVLYCVL